MPMRNGKVYSENQAQDILAFYPDDLTIKIYKPKTISVEELKEQGVLNTFSFGPTLLNNGVRDLVSRRSMRNLPAFNAVWDAWVVPGSTPARACVGVQMARSECLVELCVTAAR